MEIGGLQYHFSKIDFRSILFFPYKKEVCYTIKGKKRCGKPLMI